MNGLLLTLAWLGLSLAGWLVLATLLALVIGKGIHLADEREIAPQADAEPERFAA
jgi:hypothetical protein